jgi:hypothetical protein
MKKQDMMCNKLPTMTILSLSKFLAGKGYIAMLPSGWDKARG